MKKLTVFILIFALSFTVCNADFKDVISDAYNSGSEAVFTDIENVPWAHEAINYFVQNGIIKQNFEKKLYPNQYITREEFVDVLISAFGIYDTTATCSFIDISDEYYGCIATANKCGIVNGISETQFAPDMSITREQGVVMLFRAFNVLGITPEAKDAQIPDEALISDYALDAVNTLYAEGIIKGMADGSFAPQNTMTRAEAAVLICRLPDKIN